MWVKDWLAVFEAVGEVVAVFEMDPELVCVRVWETVEDRLPVRVAVSVAEADGVDRGLEVGDRVNVEVAVGVTLVAGELPPLCDAAERFRAQNGICLSTQKNPLCS